ncbi:PPC domain-containing DNA-binding protein [Photobacterium nomapromontoriensis]|uniref:PPC domain-containing DNA-binding protein n=1 Tax=Photobacterium nomapromontoriensis TaxID=2910237 RepID=UPI003D0ACDFE
MMIPHAFRLTEGDDLKHAILAYVQTNGIEAGSLLSGVGCLSCAKIRLANETQELVLDGPLEILTLMGTLTPDHIHLHIAVADKTGAVYGGHLVDGCIVSFTAEICLAAYQNMAFHRHFDPNTGFTELVVTPK